MRSPYLIAVLAAASLLASCAGPGSRPAWVNDEMPGTAVHGTDAGQPAPTASPAQTGSGVSSTLGRAYELETAGPWHNSDPMRLMSLRGKVVLLDFWSYTCTYCIQSMPHIEALWKKYKDAGLEVIGVHTPEFTYEKSVANVDDAIKNFGITFPVVQDDNYGTWNVYSLRYWPSTFLIDGDGNIRFKHVSAGGLDQIDAAVADLLAERRGA